MPFGGLFTSVANHDGFLSGVLDWDRAEINLVWEVQESSATDSPNGDYKLFTLCNDCQVVRIVNFCLWTKSNRVLHLHTWSYTAAHDINIRRGLRSGSFEFFYG